MINSMSVRFAFSESDMLRFDRLSKISDNDIAITSLSRALRVYLLLHVPISLLLYLPDGSRRAQDGHLVQLEELLTQAVLQVLV